MSDETRHEHAWAIARRAHQLGLSTLADRIEALVDAEVARERAKIAEQVQALMKARIASGDMYHRGLPVADVLALLAREGE